MTHGNQDHGYALVGKRGSEHVAWCAMIDRCYNPKNISYEWYGGRGIGVADVWRTDFKAFIAHIGDKPSPRHSLDRIDPNKGYEPGNVRWATSKEQRRNCRHCKLNILDVRLIRHWHSKGYKARTVAEAFGVSRALIYNIVNDKVWAE